MPLKTVLMMVLLGVTTLELGGDYIEVTTGQVGSLLGPSAKTYNRKIFIIVIKHINIRIYISKSILYTKNINLI